MRLTPLLGVFCVAFCAAALALPARAEPAGKVLASDGDVLVLRGSQILRPSTGAAVESGDQIHTGADGKILIVFTDSGLVWVRSNSDFIVDEYSYANGREAAFFSLLKGGVRSVTGLIGRRARSNFRLRVSVATIGIRGTDFSIVMCQADCRDSDGSTAAKGLYGEVLEGRIAVTPLDERSLEREFGAGEFFHLVDERSIPTPLFLPPPFLRSKLDEQARFMEKAGIAVAPGRPDAGPIASSGPGTATTGDLIGSPTSGVTGTVTNLTGGVSAVTSPVLATVGSTVLAVTSPIVTTVGSTVSTVTPIVTTVGSTVSAVTPIVTTVGSTVSTVTPIVTTVGSTVSTVTPITAPITAPVTSAPVVAPITAPVVAPIVIGAPAPSPITLPGTVTTTLPVLRR